MKKNIIITFILVALNAVSFAQSNSIYTRQGLGDNQYAHSARRVGLGGLGIVATDEYNLGSINPAGWNKLQSTRFEVGLNYSGTILSDADNSKFLSNYSFSGFTIGIPIQRDYGIVAALGVVPVTDVSYDIQLNNISAICTDCSGIEDDFNAFKYSGTGGISKFFVGISYTLPFDFTLGTTYEYYSGKIDYNTDIEFNPQSTNSNIRYQQLRSYHGVGTTFGLISSDMSSIFNSESIENFRFGAFFNYLADITTDTSLTTSTSIGTIVKDNGIVKTSIPYKLGFGAGLTWNKKYLILVDYLYQPWSEYKFNEISFGSLKDLHKVVFSVEYSNPIRRGTMSFWELLKWRAGLGYEQSQYKINGQNIDQFSIHGGFGVPLGIGNSIDFGLEYVLRGKKSNNLIQENIFKANVTINFGELWFIRRDR
jgi:hypothetical protein